MKLDEVRLHRRVGDSRAGHRCGAGIDFLHDDEVLALRGHNEGGEMSMDTAIFVAKKKRLLRARA